MKRRTRPPFPLRGLLLAVASGVAVGASFSPYGGAVLPFLAFAPLGAGLRAAARGPGGGGGRTAAAATAAGPPTAAPAAHRFPPSTAAPFTLGFATAFVAHGVGLHWMVPALAWRTGLAVPVYLLVLTMIGMLAGAACQAAVLLRCRWRWPLPLALAACWTGSEWAAAHLPGLSYAWLSAGSSLAWQPALAAGSEVLGARFLTLWTVAAGTWVGVGCAGLPGVRRRPFRLTGRTGLALAAAAIPIVAGAVRQAGFRAEEPALRVAAVQPGAEALQTASGGDLSRWIGPIRAASGDESFDLAVFPERFVALPLREPGSSGPTPAGASVASFARALGSPVLIGGVDVDVKGAPADTLWYNAAFLQSPDGGAPPSYRKTRLVPGLEGSGWWPASAPRFGAAGYARGRATVPLVLGRGRVGAMVCYDSAFGETARALVNGGAEWLAVLSNDDWLDPAAPFRATWAYWQHATHGRLRAIENRISLVQVASTGYTFAVPPSGVSGAYALQPGAGGVAVLGVNRRAQATIFTRTGDLLGPACAALLALGVAAGMAGRAGARARAVEPRTGG